MSRTPGRLFAKIRAYGAYWIGIICHYWGNAYGARSAYETAVRWYRRALELNGSLTQARLDRGVIHWRELDAPQVAVDEFSYLLALNAGNEAARFNRAVAYQQLGDYVHALADFRAYLEIGQHPQRRAYAKTVVTEFEVDEEDEDGHRQR